MRKIEINKKVIEEIFEKKKHEKDKSISNARLVLSYVLIGAAGYYLGYVSSKEDMKDWGWKKQSKKDDWKRK